MNKLCFLAEEINDPDCFAKILECLLDCDPRLAEEQLKKRVALVGRVEPKVAQYFLTHRSPFIREWMPTRLGLASGETFQEQSDAVRARAILQSLSAVSFGQSSLPPSG